MLPTLIRLCILAIILCATAESMADDLEYLQSLHDPNTDSAPAITAQSPLYNLVHSDYRSLVGEGDGDEAYVVEPQTGEVYVMPLASTAAPVERLGYSLPQLVELSPFKPPGDDERIFVGHKTTSFVNLDLLTGRILGVYGERCARDDNESSEEASVDVDTMLDDLDGTNGPPKKQRPVEVVVGRTDYQVSVHTKARGIVQTLSFTKYGLKNVHRARRKRPADDCLLISSFLIGAWFQATNDILTVVDR